MFSQPADLQTPESFAHHLLVEKVQNSLCAVLQKQDNDFLKSLRANMYQCGSGLMTVANPSSKKANAVSADSITWLRGKEHFLKDNSFLSAFDDGHRYSCILKLATSEQPGTEWSLVPTRMTFIRAF